MKGNNNENKADTIRLAEEFKLLISVLNFSSLYVPRLYVACDVSISQWYENNWNMTSPQ